MKKPAQEDDYEVQQNGTEFVDVPYEVETEELVEREVVKETVEEKLVPQIKGMYPYSGHGMKMDKGEVSCAFSLAK